MYFYYTLFCAVYQQTIVEDKEIEETLHVFEEIHMDMNPIPSYDAYIFTENKKLFGISGKEKEDIDVKLDSFFRYGGILYFSVKTMETGDVIPDTDPVQYKQVEKTYYFKQDGESVDSLTEEQFPDEPISNFVEMDIAPFKIDSTTYKDIDCSYVYKGDTPIGFKKIDSFFVASEGLWFTVSETFLSRKKGVYFWPKTGNIQQPDVVGRIW